MSTTQHASGQGIEGCRPCDQTAVTVDAESLDSTAPTHLRNLKSRLRADGCVAAEVTATAGFSERCSLSVQATTEHIRSLIDATAFLGASTLTLTVEESIQDASVESALDACIERAQRAGIELVVTGELARP